jgi:hypothetical protein
MMQPIQKGAPITAIAPRKTSIPGARSPSGSVPLGTRISPGRRSKQIAIKPKTTKGTTAKAIFVREVERGSRFAYAYEPHPAMAATKAHMTMILLILSVCNLLSNGVSIAKSILHNAIVRRRSVNQSLFTKLVRYCRNGRYRRQRPRIQLAGRTSRPARPC